jgi:hypothetical protein
MPPAACCPKRTKPSSPPFLAANEGFAQVNAQEVLAKQGIAVACGEQLRLTPAGPRHRRLLCRRAGAQGLMPAWRWLLAGLALALAAPAGALAPEPSVNVAATGTVEVIFSPWNDRGSGAAEGHRRGAGTDSRAGLPVHQQAPGPGPDRRPPPRGACRGDARRGKQSRRIGQQAARLHGCRCPVWVETRHNIAHNKVMLFDPATVRGAVVTGSYNFTRSARVANAENLLILRGNPALVRAYLGNWRRHKAEAQLLHSLDELPERKRKKDGREPDRTLAD